MRGSKRQRAVMSISANRGQWSDLIFSGDHKTIELENPAKGKSAFRRAESQQVYATATAQTDSRAL